MRALEEDLGCRLFDRMGKTILLTLAGEQMLPHAEEILKQMGQARAGVLKLSQWGQSRLRVCASSTACQYILPGVLQEFQKTFPKVQVAIFLFLAVNFLANGILIFRHNSSGPVLIFGGLYLMGGLGGLQLAWHSYRKMKVKGK